MNRPDPFEQSLRRTPWRTPPPELRAKIFRAIAAEAQKAEAEASSIRQARDADVLSDVRSWIRDWFWPHPVAWGGMAALWAGVLVLSAAFLSPQDAPAIEANATTISRAEMTALRQQRELLNSLLEESSPISVANEPGPEAKVRRRQLTSLA